jgi:predicted alpha/beta hydrolase
VEAGVGERVEIKAADGYGLAGTRFSPDGQAKAVVVIPGAMGVRQDYYFGFARYLAEQGYAALTFDYRGTGLSAPASLRGFPATATEWAEKDYNAALHAAKDWLPERPLLVAGHSLGGQLPGLVPDNHLIDAMITVATGSGYWRENTPQLKRVVWWLWYVVVPVTLPTVGYFPGKRLRMVGDLPKGVMAEWARWCRSPHYICDERGRPIRAGFQRIRFPILSLSFTDDEMMSETNTIRMHACYDQAPVELRRIAPEQIGARRIGHFGFFRSEFQDSLWHQAVAWFDRQLAAAAERDTVAS